MSVSPGGGAHRWVWARALGIAALVAIVNVFAWRLFNPPLAAEDAPARVAGLAYNAFQRYDSPLRQRLPDDAAIEADMRALAGLTTRLRTYSASEFPSLPAIAARHGIDLTLGVWLDGNAQRNAREVAAAVAAARQHSNVRRIVAGNEVLLRGSMPRAELVDTLQRLRRAVRVPVSTAEPWHVWLREPALVDQVDFITVHLLPYWEGVPEASALEEALTRLRQLRARYPNKPVVIGEIGWPSHGDAVQARWTPELANSPPAKASPDAQARFVRAFLAHAAREQRQGQAPLDYFLMEAVDQPWKRATEGRVGAHWGLLDASRAPKFAFSGPVQADPHWPTKAALSSALGLAAVAALLLSFSHLGMAARVVMALSVQAATSFFVVLGLLPLDEYLRGVDLALMLLVVLALALMVAILLVQVIEFAEMHWPWQLRGREQPRTWSEGAREDEPEGRARAPLVCIHVACCNEPPQQVIATIDSLLALDWPALEIIVVDNNTTDASRWLPVQAHAQACALDLERRRAAGGTAVPSIRFFHLPQWPGYKAGALNYALQHTDPKAQWVAVVDADYVVARDWLRQVGGWFRDARVGAVQAPQAHREWRSNRLARMMNWEYDGFFRIGMHHRHERNAIVQHGTMTVVRRQALQDAGGWDEACVCEDTEMGLRLLQRGLRVVYVDRVFGTGLVPEGFAAYRRQRQRWAQGAMQILWRHATALLGKSPLSAGQRYHFIAGWLPWIGDAAHLLFTLVAMVWTVALLAAPQAVGPPTLLFVMPLVVFFCTRLLLTPLLYRRLVTRNAADLAGAALAGMALSHAVARGVIAGVVSSLLRRRAVFHVTRKAGSHAPASTHPSLWAAVRDEAALLAGLGTCLAGVAWQQATLPDTLQIGPSRTGWMLVLCLQALPYLAALVCARLSTQEVRMPMARVVTSVDRGGE